MAIDYDDAASFCEAYEREIIKGGLFVPCEVPPQVGEEVEVAFRVLGAGDTRVTGVVRERAVDPGKSGVLIAFSDTESHSRTRELYRTCSEGTLPGEDRPTPVPDDERPTPVPGEEEPAQAPGGAAEEGSRQEIRPGDVLDNRFRIEGYLASGGMGQVFRATHVFMKRPVALKIMTRELAESSSMSARFQREAELVSRIESPHVVRVLDFGRTSGGLLFLAMELIEGQPLDKLLKAEGALPPSRGVPLLIQICQALAAAHEHGVIHRDLKPPNIIVTRRKDGGDFAKVLDFGIARAADSEGEGESAGLTQVGAILGTPEYLAPEQILRGPLDARTDIYALGVLAFKVLTGKLPFPVKRVEQLLMAHVTQKPPTPESVNPELGKLPALCAAILRALEKKKENRFESALAFAKALESSVSQELQTGELELLEDARPGMELESVDVSKIDTSGLELDLPGGAPSAGAGSETCPHCGAPCAVGAAFCGRCGGVLGGNLCVFCEAELTENATACPRCGRPVDASSPVTPSRPPTFTTGPFTAPGFLGGPAAYPTGTWGRAQTGEPSGIARPTPEALTAALERLAPSLSARRAEVLLADRARTTVGMRRGGVLAVQLLLGPGAPSETATKVRDVCMARVLEIASEHGAVLDACEADSAVFFLDGDDISAISERALRAGVACREAVEELSEAEPVRSSIGVGFGEYELPLDGAAATGPGMTAAHGALSHAPPGGVIAVADVAEAVGDRVKLEPLADGSMNAVRPRLPPSARVRGVGRDAELEQLEPLLVDACAGTSSHRLVRGEGGVGKSALFEELLQRGTKRNLLCALARPPDREHAAPYASMASALCALTRVPEDMKGQRLKPALERLKLKPSELGAALAVAGLTPAPPGLIPGVAVFAVRSVAAAAGGRRGTLLLFDDLQRADRPSLEAFRLLCQTPPPGCAVLGAASESKTVDEIARGLEPFELSPLRAGNFGALIRELFSGQPVTPELEGFLLERSGGNPERAIDWVQLLFERGFIRQGAEGQELSGAVPHLAPERLAAARVEAVGRSARRAFEAGCLFGERFESAAVDAVTGAAQQANWTRLERSGLIRPLAPGRWSVVSSRHFEAAKVRSTPEVRAALHRGIAQVLRNRADDASALLALADQLTLAGEHRSALAVWRRAAESALAGGDPREAGHREQAFAKAIAAAEAAGALPPAEAASRRIQQLARGAVLAAAGGDPALGERLLNEAEQMKVADAHVSMERVLARVALARRAGKWDPAESALAQLAKGHPPPAMAALGQAERGAVLLGKGDLPGAARSFQVALRGKQAAGQLAGWFGWVDFEAEVEGMAAEVLARGGETRGAVDGLSRALALWRKRGHGLGETRVVAQLAQLAVKSRSTANALRFFEESATIAEACGDLLFAVRQHLNGAQVHKLSGDAAGAKAKALQSKSLAAAIGWDDGVRAASALLPDEE